MHEEVIAHMRERVRHLRRMPDMAHDPRMIEMLHAMAEVGEEDIGKLEADREAAKDA